MTSTSESSHDSRLVYVSIGQLAEVLKQTVAESMQAEIEKLRLYMEESFGILATANQGIATQEEQSRTPPRRMSPVAEGVPSVTEAASPQVETLREVSDVFFNEIMIANSSASFKRQVSGRSFNRQDSDKEAPNQNNSGRSSKKSGKQTGFEELSSDGSSSHGQQSSALRDECPNLTSRVHATLPGTLEQVMPCSPRDGQKEILDLLPRERPRTIGAVSVDIRDSIISKSFVATSEPGVQYADTLLFACISRSNFLCRMGLLFLLLLGMALHVAVWLKDLTHTHPVWHSAVVVLAIAGGCSSRQLCQAKLLIKEAACWAEANGIHDAWVAASRKKQCWLFVWWMLSLLAVVPGKVVIIHHLMKAGNADEFWTGCVLAGEISTCLVFILSSTLLASASSVVCHIISALDVFIDAWSCELCECREFTEGVVSWNTVQALIRRAGVSLENVFATIQGSALLGCVAMAVQGTRFALQPHWNWNSFAAIALVLPVLPLVALAGSLLVQCASISDKCSILAPLVNQVVTPTIMDAERQYLVRFLSDSTAGVYVKGVKVNMEIVVNIIYFLAVAASGFLGLALRIAQK